MERFVKEAMKQLGTEEMSWSEIERMKIELGLHVLFHNLVMTGSILLLAKVSGIFTEAAILLVAYGLLKVTAGGIHFQKSSTCLISTATFIMVGVRISKHLQMDLRYVIGIYVLCIVLLGIIGPQGTENNPISEKNFHKLKKAAFMITVSYLVITIGVKFIFHRIPYLLLVATVFETLSLLPSAVKGRN